MSWIVAFACAHAGFAMASDKLPPGARAEGYMARLSDERFSVREAAALELERMGPDIFPQLKRLLETTDEQELRFRLRAIVKRLALSSETDPEALVRYGREEAEAQRFSVSARYYARAAEAFRSEATRHVGGDRSRWEERAQRAELRARRAEEWAVALRSGRVLEQAGRSFIILSRQANGQPAVEYQEIDLQSLTNW